MLRAAGMETAYWLFWHTNTTGSCSIEAMFMHSYSRPELEVPSPKVTIAARPLASSLDDSAAPVA